MSSTSTSPSPDPPASTFAHDEGEPSSTTSPPNTANTSTTTTAGGAGGTQSIRTPKRRPHHHWTLEEKRFVYFYRSRDIYNLDQLRKELHDRFGLVVTHDALQKEWQRINKKQDPDVIREPFDEEWAVGRDYASATGTA